MAASIDSGWKYHEWINQQQRNMLERGIGLDAATSPFLESSGFLGF
jgi:hypothetical protein